MNGKTEEALARVVEEALRVKPAGASAVRRLIRALECDGLKGQAATMRLLLEPPSRLGGRERKPGPPPLNALLKGGGLTAREKTLLKILDASWERREAIEAPGTVSLETRCGGGGGDGLTRLERSVDIGGGKDPTPAFLARMMSVELLTRRIIVVESDFRTMFGLLRALLRDRVGLREQEGALGCRSGRLLADLKWALAEFSKAAQGLNLAA